MITPLTNENIAKINNLRRANVYGDYITMQRINNIGALMSKAVITGYNRNEGLMQ